MAGRGKPLRPISLGPRALKVERKVLAGYEGNLALARAVEQESCCSQQPLPPGRQQTR